MSAYARCTFLRGAGLAALALAPIGIRAARALAAETRSLSFVHTHTGEKLSAVYFKEGSYDQGALERISHLLRDFRTLDCCPGLHAWGRRPWACS